MTFNMLLVKYDGKMIGNLNYKILVKTHMCYFYFIIIKNNIFFIIIKLNINYFILFCRQIFN